MHWLDWTILLGTLGFIVGYGVWKTRHTRTSEGYLRGGDDARWWGVGLSVMATQASAITFLSTPGQGFTDGLGFVQFYFGLPLAMVVINLVFIPLYYKWKVFTAYEFIGKRFDRRARLLTAGLFLVQRSMAAGITIYAPGIILSKVLGWPLTWTCLFIGVLVTIYTTTGGARAVGVTHKQQMAVIFGGLFVAFGLVVHYLGEVMTFPESMRLAGTLGKLNAVDLSFDPADKYTLWSGLIGGFFLQLSYFGTDQSQVQRYLGGQTMEQAKRGLWMNALLKIPMQYFILLTGVLVFVFYLVNAAPVHWNATNLEALRESAGAPQLEALEARHAANNAALRAHTVEWLEASRNGDAPAMAGAERGLDAALDSDKHLRAETTDLVKTREPGREANDRDYIFITFIMDHLPIGVIGLLLAMIFSAGMSSTSAELSALATTSVVDVLPARPNDTRLVRRSRWATVFFGLLALAFAALFSLFENLIQAVNILGSLFYGTILGIFLVAFFLKHVQGTAVFVAAILAQAAIFALHFSGLEVAFLWYNLIAPAITVVLALVLQPWVATPQRAPLP
ncbi:MAG: sodium:solute symporter [Flavobacteriales bacterium]|nr:sodium:solute symporter [Flavobacteriales bacterium]MBP9081089.1 sodium:solute symporter [Flavobacteriales bacterium]